MDATGVDVVLPRRGERGADECCEVWRCVSTLYAKGAENESFVGGSYAYCIGRLMRRHRRIASVGLLTGK